MQAAKFGSGWWCDIHNNPIKQGTRRCMSCTADHHLPVRRVANPIPKDQLRPMRRPGQPTKRAIERRQKGYVS